MSALDQDLNSRQIWTYGLEAMKKMAASSVAVLGMNGLGAEVAKNLILANVKHVALLDDRDAVVSDLSTHFYLSEQDIGHNRALACRDRLQELNPAVCVTSQQINLNDYFSAATLLSQQGIGTVVLCDVSLNEAEKLNKFCRQQIPPINFVMAQACGLCFRVFSDFGPTIITTTTTSSSSSSSNAATDVTTTTSSFTFVSIETPYTVRWILSSFINFCLHINEY
jgi:ubiquitin-activating enzyme E1